MQWQQVLAEGETETLNLQDRDAQKRNSIEHSGNSRSGRNPSGTVDTLTPTFVAVCHCREWGGMYSSLRTFSMIIAPLIYAKTYTISQRPGLGWLSPWFAVAVLGAIVPECLHRTLSDKALQLDE